MVKRCYRAELLAFVEKTAFGLLATWALMLLFCI